MNTTFNFNRFLKVLSNEWRLNWKKMLLFWGVVVAIGIFLFAFQWNSKELLMLHIPLSIALLLMTALLGFYLQIYFREFSSKKKTQALLLLPASRSEVFWAKFSLGFIPYILIFILLIIGAVEWTKIQNVWLKEILNLPATDWRMQQFEELYQTSSLFTRILLYNLMVWVVVASGFLLGMMSFKKWAAVKTTVAVFLTIMGLVLTTIFVYFLFTGDRVSQAFPGIIIITQSNPQFGNLSANFAQRFPMVTHGFYTFVALTLILIARVKYNEKTI